ncbi:MAG: Nif3-like dinuclear metal center hexameric protein, partial [Clostridia bacterium]|nr:Nif3-like dinuclear metal center hexameric protein [Clostridia bacterium]
TEKAQLIFSHHPILFEPIKSVNESDKVYQLIKNNVAALCAHTNLDIAQDGLNDILFNMLELQQMKWLSFDNSQAIGRWGSLSNQTTVKEFALKVKELLNSNVVRYVDGNRYVKNVAVITGAGGSDYKTALLCGADTLVTGDAKYHTFLDAYEIGFNIIEAGHFSTENIILPVLKKKIENKFPEIEVIISKKHRDIIKVI